MPLHFLTVQTLSLGEHTLYIAQVCLLLKKPKDSFQIMGKKGSRREKKYPKTIKVVFLMVVLCIDKLHSLQQVVLKSCRSSWPIKSLASNNCVFTRNCRLLTLANVKSSGHCS